MKYINAAVRVVSLVVGGVFFGMATMILWLIGVKAPWAGGMIAGAAATMIAAAVLAYISYRENVKFAEARRRVEGTILEFSLATVCNFGKSRRAYVFLTAETMRLFLWDKHPYLESTIRREEVVITYRAARPNYLTIVYEDDDRLELAFPNAENLVAAMRENGYRVKEENEHV